MRITRLTFRQQLPVRLHGNSHFNTLPSLNPFTERLVICPLSSNETFFVLSFLSCFSNLFNRMFQLFVSCEKVSKTRLKKKKDAYKPTTTTLFSLSLTHTEVGTTTSKQNNGRTNNPTNQLNSRQVFFESSRDMEKRVPAAQQTEPEVEMG